MVRDIDKLDSLPDERIREMDQEYLSKHNIDKLFGQLLEDILQRKPKDPVQFMIDAISMNPEEARQDATTGLPQHRKAQLEQVFKAIDKEGSGRISLRKLQTHATKYGGELLGADELRKLFADFKPAADGTIGLGEFLQFFARVSATMGNAQFTQMVDEMKQ